MALLAELADQSWLACFESRIDATFKILEFSKKVQKSATVLARCGVPVPCPLCLRYIIHPIKGYGVSPLRGNALPLGREHTFASILLQTHHPQLPPGSRPHPQNGLPISLRKRVLFSTHQDEIPHRSLKSFGMQNDSQNGPKLITKPSWNPDRIRTLLFSLFGTANGAHNP